MIRVLLADDDELIREALRALLEHSPAELGAFSPKAHPGRHWRTSSGASMRAAAMSTLSWPPTH